MNRVKSSNPMEGVNKMKDTKRTESSQIRQPHMEGVNKVKDTKRTESSQIRQPHMEGVNKVKDTKKNKIKSNQTTPHGRSK
ncbi:hypothetical protein CEXT_734441 [Caerostris extrusa]|uniref:Uncharacterized protein n=1 Tax=Caerostris extrusa TaxID=172846 RepID=A0AAV4N907_CAEEX|nr:hypothetical protein CEXT_734441 [Caerostris extrusa]